MNSISRIFSVYQDFKIGNLHRLIYLQNDNVFVDEQLMEYFRFRYMIKNCLIEE